MGDQDSPPISSAIAGWPRANVVLSPLQFVIILFMHQSGYIGRCCSRAVQVMMNIKEALDGQVSLENLLKLHPIPSSQQGIQFI